MRDTTDPLEPPADGNDPSLAAALIGFTRRLRDAGIPVSMVEMLDGVEAMRSIDPLDRPQFKAALAATLVKRSEHRPLFDGLFETWFAIRREARETQTSLDRPGDVEGVGVVGASDETEGPASTDLLAKLVEALRSDDIDALRILAELAVSRFAGVEGERSAPERYYLYRVLRQLELAELLRQAMALERGEVDGDLSLLDQRLLRDEHLARMEEFRRLISQEIRRRLGEQQRETGDAPFQDRPIEEADFLGASPSELRRMRETIRPLARKLAARMARRRRLRRRGRLDVRKTLRRSLSAGGVPLDPEFRRPHASKPDLYLICDISGSVSEFARFTMSLLHAVREEFSRIRLFAFVDGIDEVTELMDSGHELAPRNLLYGTKVIAADGHSDYGSVFRRFWHVYGHADLDPRATVIITGDARNNYRDPGSEAFASIAERARKVYWLNPEPAAEWNTTDSIIGVYAHRCHEVVETRNLTQLADFVSHIT